MSYDFNIRQHIKAARSRHKCGETKAVIEPGQGYVRLTGKFEGDFYSHKMSAEIYPIWKRWNDRCWDLDDDGIIFGDLGAEMNETLRDNQTPDPQDLADAQTFLKLWGGSAEHYLSKTVQSIIAKS